MCFFGFGLVSVTGQCNSVPISLSNLTSCTGTSCLLTQTAYLSIPLATGSSACIEFVSPDGVSNTEMFNISISHSFYKYKPSFIYWTDDAWLEGAGNCKCPPTTGYTRTACENEKLDVANYTATVWIYGVNSGAGCPLSPTGLSGSHCYKIGVNALKRFKVLDMGVVPTKDIGFSLSYTDGNQTYESWETEYSGISVYEMNSDNTINVTIISDTSTRYFDIQNIVFDTSDTSDFYILDDSDVNSIDSFDTTKIGWVKPDQPIRIPPNMANLIPLDVSNCLVDKFGVVSPFVSIEDKLLQNRHRLSSVIAPGSILADPNYYFGLSKTSLKTAPDVNLKPWHYLRFGWLLANHDGPQFLGVTQAGEFLPLTTGCGVLPMLQNITTNVGQYRNLSSLTVCWADMQVFIPQAFNIGGSYGYWLVKFITYANISGNFTEYGVCTMYNGAIGVDFTSVSFASAKLNYLAVELGSCFEPNFNSTAWPTLAIGNFKFNGTFSQSYTGYSSDINAVSLSNPIYEGVANVLVTFKDLNIQFQSNSIKPKIISVGTNNVDGVWVFAQSVTVGGVCFIGTYPAGIFTTQSVTLGLNPLNNTYVFAPVAYKSQISVVIRCAQSTSEATLFVNYDLSPNQSKLNNITDTTAPIDWWFPNFDWPFVFPKIPGIDKAVTDWILLVVYWIVYIIIIVAVLWIVFMLAKWLFCWFLKSKLLSRIPVLNRFSRPRQTDYPVIFNKKNL